MKLYIAEKPSLARAVADALPKPHRKAEGCIYVGNGDVVSWCIGHLLTQVDPEAYDPAYKKWQFEHLPIIPQEWKLKSNPKTSKQLTILKKLIKQADHLVHVGDPDREYCYTLSVKRDCYTLSMQESEKRFCVGGCQ